MVTWGDPEDGGDSGEVQDRLVGVQAIQSSSQAFVALLSDGSAVAWGHPDFGGDARQVDERLTGVLDIQASEAAFAARRRDGTVVTWGSRAHGGDSSVVTEALRGVQQIQSSLAAFAALTLEGAAVAWGEPESALERLKGVAKEEIRDLRIDKLGPLLQERARAIQQTYSEKDEKGCGHQSGSTCEEIG